MAITDSWLKVNHRKPRTKAIVKTDRDGLSARVSPKGKITYSLRYYYAGKQTRADIGTYQRPMAINAHASRILSPDLAKAERQKCH